MINLAGNKNCDCYIRDELTRCRIPIVEWAASSGGEVNSTLTGQLGPFEFRRAWYYWVVKGPVPMSVAEELYADPVGVSDIRAGGRYKCHHLSTQLARRFGADLPDTVDCYHIDTEVGLRLFADTIRKHGLDKESTP